MDCPPTTRHAGRHRRRSLAIALWLALSTTVDRVVQRLLERLMWPREVIVGPPPLQMEQQLWSRLHRRPSAAHEGCHALAHCQIDAFDKGAVQLSAQAQPSECRVERRARPAAQHVRDPHQPSSLIAFFNLTIDQLVRLRLTALPYHS